MSDPYIGQIIAVAFNYAPEGWAFCDGSVLPIDDNSALFSLIGTTYGGDGQATFALPDLRGRIVVDSGQGPALSAYSLGQRGGAETVAPPAGQVGAHSHVASVAAAGSAAQPGSTLILSSTATTNHLYAATGTKVALASDSITFTGASAPHENRQPVVTLNYIIALNGVYPSQN